MHIAVRIIGTFILCMGIIVIVEPKTARKMMAFWRRGKNIYLGAAIRLIFGIIFLIAAPSSRFPAVLSILGILAIIGAATIVILGVDKSKAMIARFDKKPDSFLRLIMLVALLFGALLVWSA